MGTGTLTENEETGLGLAGEHDYAVIDMKEDRGQRLFLVKNPWSEGTTWKGHIRYVDDITSDFADLDVNASPGPGRATRTPLTPGTFWIGLDHVLQSFESIYLNWNPGLFSRRQDAHFEWDLTSSSSSEGCFRSNPQYSIINTSGGIIWVLLSKHFKSRHDPSRNSESGVSSPANPELGFISLYAFNNDGYRVISSGGAIVTSRYVDSPNSLLRLDMPPQSTYTIVVSQQSLPKAPHTFTLSSLSLAPVTMTPAKTQYAYTLMQRGRWTPSTAGGNAGSPLYHTNPQFSIKFLDPTDVSLVLETPSESLPVHVNLVWAAGGIVRSVTTRDILGDSGEYTKSFAIAEINDVPAGTYTIVCSTFEQSQIGEFNLHVSTNTKCQIARLPAFGAGRYVCGVEKALFEKGENRLVMSVLTRRINRISVTAQSRGSRASSDRGAMSPLMVSLELGKGSSAHIIATSGNGDFVDSNLTGAYIQDISIDPNMCMNRGLWIALERLVSSGSAQHETIAIDIRSDEPLEISPWTAAAQ